MLLRRKQSGVLYRARLNPRFRIGDHLDPLLEIYRRRHWVGLMPAQMGHRFEILAASSRETNQLALLTEYPLRYARDFRFHQRRAPCQGIGLQ